MHLRTKFFGLLLVALSIPTLALADTTITGQKKGAFFQITVPTVWNGSLVINNHGFDFNPPAANPGLGALAPLQLAEGYAVAASSYSNCCWTLFSTKKDLNRLLEVFEDNFGAPSDVIVHGGSLGGIVTAQAVEKLDIEPVGSYPICGALSGSRSWDGAIDLRLVYDAVCGAVGVLPGGATGLPAPGFPTAGLSTAAIAGAVNACTGVLTPVAFRTPAQTARLNQIKAVTTLPENFIVTDMVFVTNGLSNLIFAPDKLDGGQGVGNIGVTYNDAGINASIQRVAANNKAAKELDKNYTPKGEVNATKTVSIHTDGDGLVIVENEKEYADVVPASQLSTAIVDEAGNTHCGFTSPELVSGWEELRDWIAGGPQPTASDIQSRCLTLGPAAQCRYNAAYVVNDMDTRIPPR
ncbi:MAG TPA: hypothetical protein VII72_22585 [Myxococcota bacterium]